MREGWRGDAGRMEGRCGKVDSGHAGTWDSAAVLALGHVSSSKKMLINSKALKITACAVGANYVQSIKRQNTPVATCEDTGAIAGSSACPLKYTPAKGWAGHLSFPSNQTPGHTPTLTSYKEQGHPSGVSKGTINLFLLPPTAAAAGVKPCLDFLPGLSYISVDWGRPRTLMVIRIKDAAISLGLEL